MGHKDPNTPIMGQVTELEKQEVKDLTDGLKASQTLKPLGAIEYPTHLFVKTQDGQLWVINRVRNCLVIFDQGN